MMLFGRKNGGETRIGRVEFARGVLHFKDCHPGQIPPEGWAEQEPAELEDCWHCDTPTPRGCNCSDCWHLWDHVGEGPPSALYHCPLCRRWWSHMSYPPGWLRPGLAA